MTGETPKSGEALAAPITDNEGAATYHASALVVDKGQGERAMSDDTPKVEGPVTMPDGSELGLSLIHI